MTATTLFVCTTCRGDGQAEGETRPGALFYTALRERLGEGAIQVEPVECLAVCKRPCTVALAAEGKWTYVVGDLDLTEHVEDVLRAALAYEASETGIVAWKERPLCFRKGVVSRAPPLKQVVRNKETEES